ncbi:MAG: B-box zinc finger protein [Acidobacteriota bacterium]|nr:B-box zinc finger protein [Acidobacteriota bacterium]
MPPTTQRCSAHEQRPAFARCMTCAKMLCQECATQWDGIWHCASCLGSRRGAVVQRSQFFGWVAVATLSLLMLFAGARVMVWMAAMIAGLF